MTYLSGRSFLALHWCGPEYLMNVNCVPVAIAVELMSISKNSFLLNILTIHSWMMNVWSSSLAFVIEVYIFCEISSNAFSCVMLFRQSYPFPCAEECMRFFWLVSSGQIIGECCLKALWRIACKPFDNSIGTVTLIYSSVFMLHLACLHSC